MTRTVRPVLAAACGGVAMWLLAGLWHTVLMASFYTERAHGEHVGLPILLAAYLVLGGLMTWVYRRRPARRPLLEGLKVGALVGVLWVFPHELAMAGAHGEPLAYVFQNAAWHVVEQGFGGLVVGGAHAWRGGQ